MLAVARRCRRRCALACRRRTASLWKTVMNIGGTFCRKYSLSARGKISGVAWRAQFVGHLIDDEIAAGHERIVGVLENLALLADLHVLNGMPEST